MCKRTDEEDVCVLSSERERQPEGGTVGVDSEVRRANTVRVAEKSVCMSLASRRWVERMIWKLYRFRGVMGIEKKKARCERTCGGGDVRRCRERGRATPNSPIKHQPAAFNGSIRVRAASSIAYVWSKWTGRQSPGETTWEFGAKGVLWRCTDPLMSGVSYHQSRSGKLVVGGSGSEIGPNQNRARTGRCVQVQVQRSSRRRCAPANPETSARTSSQDLCLVGAGMHFSMASADPDSVKFASNINKLVSRLLSTINSHRNFVVAIYSYRKLLFKTRNYPELPDWDVAV
ncbi:hypothetical protein C8R45DRAFT_1079842 [Mycena sanguinolenta]|nr:hypothetical protein C8R45DRAFT_1079842 [Mycena sanguinolenta]